MKITFFKIGIFHHTSTISIIFTGGFNIWIGIDDTDSRKFGCTTYLINDLLAEFQKYTAIGSPSLVRLNPNIPWKTRGNGAVCIRLEPKDKVKDEVRENKFQIGTDEYGKPIYGYSLADNTQFEKATKDELAKVIECVDRIITAKAALEDNSTNPGVVVTGTGLPLELYWQVVWDVVEIDVIKKKLTSMGAMYKGYKNGRGIIGASAAIAWSSHLFPRHLGITKPLSILDSTYELITYRSPSQWGTQRHVSPEAVRELDRRYPSTFNNYDHTNNHVVITPNSPCPILFGVRGDSIADLYSALPKLAENAENIEKWLMFRTNQGTDDHLISTRIHAVKPYSSVIVTGRVRTKPLTITGGHVLFNIEDPAPGSYYTRNKLNVITCAAYEPTKGFRSIVRGLLPGDIVSVYGGVRTEPKTINIEKLAITKLVQNKIKLPNPRCPICKRAMKSIGEGKGYRCRTCHQVIRSDRSFYTTGIRQLVPGLYEVPVAARRHLSKPLKRGKWHPGIMRNPPKSL